MLDSIVKVGKIPHYLAHSVATGLSWPLAGANHVCVKRKDIKEVNMFKNCEATFSLKSMDTQVFLFYHLWVPRKNTGPQQFFATDTHGQPHGWPSLPTIPSLSSPFLCFQRFYAKMFLIFPSVHTYLLHARCWSLLLLPESCSESLTVILVTYLMFFSMTRRPLCLASTYWPFQYGDPPRRLKLLSSKLSRSQNLPHYYPGPILPTLYKAQTVN